MKDLTLNNLQKYLASKLPASIKTEIRSNQYIVADLKQPLYFYFKDQSLEFTDDTETWSKLINALDKLNPAIENKIRDKAYNHIKNRIFESDLTMRISPINTDLNLNTVNLDDLTLDQINRFEIVTHLDLTNKFLKENIVTSILIYNDLYNDLDYELKTLSTLTKNNYQKYQLERYHQPNIELE